MSHREKEGLVLSLLVTDNFQLSRRLGISHTRLCRWYRGTEAIDRTLLHKALSVIGTDEEVFGYMVSHMD